MRLSIKFFTVLSLLIFAAISVHAGKRDPVAVLFQVKGKVEYTKNGKKWKKVRRNKFLFAGYQVRSSANGSGKLTIKTTGTNLMLQPNTILEITTDNYTVVQGDVEQAKQANKLVSGLIKKFTKSQSYTTVRRGTAKKDMDAVRSVVVSNDYPYLVWDNINDQYSYTVKVGEKEYDVSPSSGQLVRLKVEPFAGKKEFFIFAKDNKETVAELQPYKSRGKYRNHNISWLSDKKQKELEMMVAELQADYGEDTFMLGTFFEKQRMWVAAMDQYKRYLDENPDDIEMTPYLFRVYKKLKLNNVYKTELAEWNQAMAE